MDGHGVTVNGHMVAIMAAGVCVARSWVHGSSYVDVLNARVLNLERILLQRYGAGIQYDRSHTTTRIAKTSETVSPSWTLNC